jgi:hypothetical protein
MGIAKEHRHHFAAEIRQLPLLTVEIGELEILAEVRAGDVGGTETGRLRTFVAGGQREDKRKTRKQSPEVAGKDADSQTRMRQ